jgi:uncharacterized protein (DUF3820 family)
MVKSVTTTPHRLRFGKYKGRTLDEVPPDYLNGLRKFDGLFAITRRMIESHLRALVRDPGQARMPFGCHAGQLLDELKTSYLDWLVGSDVELGGALAWLIKAELRRRESCVPVDTGEQEDVVAIVLDAEGHEHRFRYTRPKVVGYVPKLPEVEDWVPYDTHGFIPSEALGGGDRKPSAWSMSRPRAQVQAEDEALNQVWNRAGGQRLLFREGLDLPPVRVGQNRRDRNRAYWASTEAGPVLKGSDDTDVQRLKLWDSTLEALDAVGHAEDLLDLEDAYYRALRLTELLARDEHWDVSSNTLRDELDQVYGRRREQLARREVSFSDAEKRLDPYAGSVARWARGDAIDMVPARVHEAVRRMRGCRSTAAVRK